MEIRNVKMTVNYILETRTPREKQYRIWCCAWWHIPCCSQLRFLYHYHIYLCCLWHFHWRYLWHIQWVCKISQDLRWLNHWSGYINHLTATAQLSNRASKWELQQIHHSIEYFTCLSLYRILQHHHNSLRMTFSLLRTPWYICYVHTAYNYHCQYQYYCFSDVIAASNVYLRGYLINPTNKSPKHMLLN